MAPSTLSSSSRKFAVVTGASSGIGQQLAKQFAQNGYDLLITSNTSDLTSCAAELESCGALVETLQCDLAQAQGVDELYQHIQAHGRAVDAVAINAGVGVGGPFIETDLQAELNLIALNVTSSVHLAKHVARDMAARGSGRILFTSSIAATMPGPFEAVYAASKAFLLSFAEALRHELKDRGVTVTALMPGPTETNFFHRAGMDNTKVGQSKKDSPADVAKDGFKALVNGDDHVLAGSAKNKIQGDFLAKILPETVKAAMHANQSRPKDAA